MRVKDTEEAVRTANDTEYELSAGVFGRDIGRAINIAKCIDSGICHVNRPCAMKPKCRSATPKRAAKGTYGGRRP